MKREDRLLKSYFAQRVREVPGRIPPDEGANRSARPGAAARDTGPRNRIITALAYAAMLAAAVLPLSGVFRDNPLAATVTAVYREYGMETRAEEGIERFFLTLKSRLDEEKNL
jgi:hypothetical protein